MYMNFAESIAPACSPAVTGLPREDRGVRGLMIADGPGRGAVFPLSRCPTSVGRGDDQDIRLAFGDDFISRDRHAVILYDQVQDSYLIRFGGKQNLVRLNGLPVLGTEPLVDGDRIRIGHTTLEFGVLPGG